MGFVQGVAISGAGPFVYAVMAGPSTRTGIRAERSRRLYFQNNPIAAEDLRMTCVIIKFTAKDGCCHPDYHIMNQWKAVIDGLTALGGELE